MAEVVDINVSFALNPVNKTVSQVSGKRAIAQYISNLLSIQLMEIPFKEHIGSGLMGLLGEACSNITASLISEQINQLLTLYVPYMIQTGCSKNSKICIFCFV